MQKKNFTILILFMAVLLLLTYIFTTSKLSNPQSYSQGLKLVEQAFPQYKVIKSFDTGISLEGYVLEDKGDIKKRTVTFTSKDGSVLVNGELLAWDRNQNKLTSLNQIYTNYFTSDEEANELYLDIQKFGSYIQQGSNDAPHKFYAIIDPSCSYCSYLFTASQPAIKEGLLAVRWLPVGALHNSPKIVNSFFNSKDPLKAFISYHDTNKYDENNTEENDKALNNMNLSKNIQGFPTIVYKTPQDALKISGGDKLPLIDAASAEKSNVKKINEFLLLTSDKF
ncbi:DsbC family protein [Francisella adeliensis]|uniref:DsbC family protein n=1 Tax=Francisella adeliensis TaxID=2007306 RepID=A0A2Z4XZ96_9GAMM|nr:DsbC family protein [Francisella adeliensis]AXA33996.1 thiol:disulfide interchange protein [Francisella adeliensis]MBK2085909.1 DsbC family protein [Francisella adeliensis]MBK2097787.1 DsbC family protein [Francisella adeliensis]QIW12233.1 DsbC family protein [Francisella adeliensis]QIW14109.1 DsbC family protein [Francisella adeliensis]